MPHLPTKLMKNICSFSGWGSFNDGRSTPVERAFFALIFPLAVIQGT
jgi:hypothetical protein